MCGWVREGVVALGCVRLSVGWIDLDLGWVRFVWFRLGWIELSSIECELGVISLVGLL